MRLVKMKSLILFFFIVSYSKLYSQTNSSIQITFKGYLRNNPIVGSIFNGPIFYSNGIDHFSIQRSIISDSINHKYSFNLSETIYNNDKIDKLIFSIDSSYNTSDNSNCFQVINLSAIRNFVQTKDMKSIEVETDLYPEMDCYSTPDQVKEDYEMSFIGDYKMIVNDTVYNVKLGALNKMYVVKMSNPIDILNDEITGYWYFDAEKLIINSIRWGNKQFGTIRLVEREFSFVVTKSKNGFYFKTSNDCKLQKL
ncbi:MAG: hypothetical protein WCK82_13365 [Bacteroidota bacterium]